MTIPSVDFPPSHPGPLPVETRTPSHTLKARYQRKRKFSQEIQCTTSTAPCFALHPAPARSHLNIQQLGSKLDEPWHCRNTRSRCRPALKPARESTRRKPMHPTVPRSHTHINLLHKTRSRGTRMRACTNANPNRQLHVQPPPNPYLHFMAGMP